MTTALETWLAAMDGRVGDSERAGTSLLFLNTPTVRALLGVVKALAVLAAYDDFAAPGCPQCAPTDPAEYQAARQAIHDALAALPTGGPHE